MTNFLWTQKQDIGPKPRMSHRMAFDATRNLTVLFGGTALAGGLFNDTWEWDGKLWTQVGDMGPSPRSDHAMAFDIERKRTILFGGEGSDQKLGDTWEWDGENWTQLSNSGPQPRKNHALVYDSKRKRIILFGGETVDGATNDTWEFNGEEWSQLDNSGPSARQLHSMTYDSIRDRVILFGGVADSNSNGLNDTWEWNGTNWTQVSDFGPPPCIRGSMVFMKNNSVLFGGANSLNTSPPPVLFDNTWGWDGRHWTQYQDIGPSERWGHAAVFDVKRKSIMLFGGISVVIDPGNGTAAGKLLGDTWEHLDTSEDPVAPPPDPGPVSIIAFELSQTDVPLSSVQDVVAGVMVSNTVIGTEVIVHLHFNTQEQPGGNSIYLTDIIIPIGENTGGIQLPGGVITESGFIIAIMEDGTFKSAAINIQ